LHLPLKLPRSLAIAASLIIVHLVLWAYVISQEIQYDQNDLEGILWWIVAFLILPAIAVIVVAISFVAWLIDRAKNSGG